MDASASSSSAPENVSKKQPSVIITIGMAGAGKSTFVQRLNSHLHAKNTPPYIMNLDPAITHSAFEANIDIRDTVDYKQVMKQCVFFAIDHPFFMVLIPEQVQFRTQRRDLDCFELVHDEIRSSTRAIRKASRNGRVSLPFCMFPKMLTFMMQSYHS